MQEALSPAHHDETVMNGAQFLKAHISVDSDLLLAEHLEHGFHVSGVGAVGG